MASFLEVETPSQDDYVRYQSALELQNALNRVRRYMNSGWTVEEVIEWIYEKDPSLPELDDGHLIKHGFIAKRGN